MPRLGRAAILLAWMALIIYWSGQGSLPIDQPPFAAILFGLQHRLAHLIAYGLLALLARWTLDGLPRSTLLAVVFASAFGATDEWHQTFTPGRRPALDDWLVDSLAAGLGVWLRARLVGTRWQPPLRRLAPLAVACAMLIGVGFALAPYVASGRAAQHALDLARQLRAVTSG
jgi:VanZ family protein